jgi:hypothetical protein
VGGEICHLTHSDHHLNFAGNYCGSLERVGQRSKFYTIFQDPEIMPYELFRMTTQELKSQFVIKKYRRFTGSEGHVLYEKWQL